jgi:hypothetical protein
VIEWGAVPRVLVVKLVEVTPPDVDNVSGGLIATAPSKNVTVPDGKATAVDPEVTATVAVNVTDCPDTDVLFTDDEVSALVVDALLTI